MTIKKGTTKNPLVLQMEKLKRLLLYRESLLPGKNAAPRNKASNSDFIPLTREEQRDNFAMMEGFEGNEGMKLQFLQVLLKVLDNHPDEKMLFFQVIQKLMEDPDDLTRSEIKFMMVIAEETIFLLNTEDSDAHENAVYH